MIHSYTDIDAYKNSKRLYPQIVQATKGFPPQGWHLRDQSCRSANAIHADIAEGFGRSVPEFKNYLSRALGSCNETRSHLEDAMNVGWMDRVVGQELINEYTIISKQIYRLREKWK